MAATIARESGYTGNSPAMLNAFEQIHQRGIREARAGHLERKRIVDQFKAAPGMFFATIRPSLSTAEAIEDANRVIFNFRNLPTWQQQARLGQVRKAKQTRVIARYFRRFGLRLWAQQAA